MTAIRIELTQTQRDFLASLLYQVVRGPNDPENIGPEIFAKLLPADHQRFDVGVEQSVDGFFVVVSER